MKLRRRTKVILVVIAMVWVLGWLVTMKAGPRAKRFEYGVTFSYPYAQNLGLDWRMVYLATLDELKPDAVRIPVYWNMVESVRERYDFSAVDFQVDEADKRGVDVILAVGRRLPRWPECHDPAWLKDLGATSQQNSQLEYVEETVLRYSKKLNVVMWQVENEPFLGTFGECPSLDLKFYDQELALVRRLDPGKPILVTDSGELSMWVKSGSRGDVFGTTLYRFVFSDIFNRYWSNFYIPRWFYRFKGGLLRIANPGKPILIAELQAGPWTTKGIVNTPIEEQFRTMSLGHFRYLTQFARDTGYSPQYLWGVEWWYWMKTQDHPEFWEESKKLIQNK